MAGIEDQQRIPLPGLVAAWLVGAAAFDFPASWAFESPTADLPILAAFVFGALVGQFGVLGYWAVFGPQRLAVRWTLALVVAWALWSLFQAGWAAQSYHGPDIHNYLWQITLLPLVLLAGQLPLWIEKAIWGHATVRAEEGGLAWQSGRRQYGLLQMIVATGVVAAALGLARVYVQELSEEGRGEVSLLAALYFTFIAAVASLLFVPAAMFAALGARRVKLGLVVMIVYGVLIVASLTGLAVATGVRWAPGEAVAVFLALVSGALTVLCGTLWLLRRQGYRLVRPPSACREARPA